VSGRLVPLAAYPCAAALQAFVNSSFEHITSTEHAANLLAQFNAILQRDALKQELDSKHQVSKLRVFMPCAILGVMD